MVERRVSLAAFRGSEERMLKMITAYDTEILGIDRELDRLYRGLSGLSLLEGSVWILVADHGEGLGSHGVLGHGVDLYGEAIRVPLVVHDPEGRIAPRRIASVVEHTDLAPTLAELAGIPDGFDGSGRSWAPMLVGEEAPPARRFALAQRRDYEGSQPRSGPGSEFDDRYESGEKFALRSDSWSYILRSDGPAELYDLVADPFEKANLAGRDLAIETELHSQLAARIRALRSRAPETRSVDDETLKRLESLGYLR